MFFPGSCDSTCGFLYSGSASFVPGHTAPVPNAACFRQRHILPHSHQAAHFHCCGWAELIKVSFCETGVSVEGDTIGERSLRRALNQYIAHFHRERNHQGKGNVLLFPEPTHSASPGSRGVQETFGGSASLLSPRRMSSLTVRGGLDAEWRKLLISVDLYSPP